MDEAKLLKSIKKIVDESINGNIKKIVDESINDNIKKILDEALVPIKKDIEDLKIGLKKTNERIDYYHKPIEPSMTELMPLKSVISLSVLREPTLKWIEKMYKEILRQIQSKKYKGIWINTPKKWYQQTLELFKEVDSKNLFEITTWNDITVT